MNSAQILDRLHDLGVTVHLNGAKVRMEPGSKVPAELLAEVRQHKTEVLALLQQGRDFAATACICPEPIGGTGPDRCGVCEMPLLCPRCERCRGCKHRLRFP